MMTAFSDVETAVKAMKSGARDFIAKPFDIEDLEKITDSLFDYLKLIQERDILKVKDKAKTHSKIVGKSKQF